MRPYCERKRLRERLSEQRLRRAGHAFKQDVAAGQEAGEHQIDGFVLANDGFANFRFDCVGDATYAG